MLRKMIGTIATTVLAQAVGLNLFLWADTGTKYPSMASVEQYLMPDRSAEIALARSAAPGTLSDSAEVMVLSPQGYDIAVPGTNGFVCLVQRSWIAQVDDPDFWNPKLRSPICLNPAGARSYLPIIIMRTRLILAGMSKVEMSRAIESALDKKELPPQQAGAMGYMMSKQGYLSDRDGRWHPHLMFFVPLTEAKAGAQVCRALPSLDLKILLSD